MVYIHFNCISINNFQENTFLLSLSSISEILASVLGPVLRALAGLLVVTSNALITGPSTPSALSEHGVSGQEARVELALRSHLILSVGQHRADDLNRQRIIITKVRSDLKRSHSPK